MTEFRSPSSSPRLLVLSPFAPRLDAPHGGGRTLAQFLLKISQSYNVGLLYMQASDEPPIDPAILERVELARNIIRTWAGPSFSQKITRNLRLMAAMLNRKPLWVADWESQPFSFLVRSVVQSWQPDIVQIEYNIMAQYLTALNGCPAPRVLVEYEPARLAAPFLHAGPAFVRSLAHHIDRSAWEKFEPTAIKQVQAVVAFTPKDQETIADYGLPTPISLIPFGTDLSSAQSNSIGSQPLSLLFVGNFNHPPNCEAAIRLIRDIFPTVREKYPNLTCIIVGLNPPRELRSQAGNGVTITGWVPDLAPYFDSAALFVVPIKTGGGLRVKVLEALAAGKAIVATPLALEGLEVKDGEHIFLAESDADFVLRIDQLLANPLQRASLGAKAHAWACDNLSWEKTIGKYEHLYQTLLSGVKL